MGEDPCAAPPSRSSPDRRGPALPVALAAVTIAAVTIAAGTAAAQEVSVGENVHVSSALPDRAHYELHVASHPSDPEVLLGAGMVWSDSANKYDLVAYRTTDGGRSWSPTLELAREGTIQDPAVAFGPDGWAYLSEFGGGEHPVHRSPDGGATWADPVDLGGGDRPWLAVSGPEAETPGRLFRHSTGRTAPADREAESLTGLRVARADAHGEEPLPSSTLHLSGDRSELGTGESVVLSDGTFVFLYPERLDLSRVSVYEGAAGPDPRIEREPNARLRALVSRNGGAGFEPARTVGDWHHRFGRGRTATVPAVAADTSRGPFRDRIYAAWTDFRSGEGQILLSRSEDRGRSWSEPVVVNRGGGPAFRPMLAVNGDGVLGIAWYDRRDSATGLGWHTRFAASLDGGETVGPSVRVSDADFRYEWDRGLVVVGRQLGGENLGATALLHAFNDMGGHTAGMAADASGRFHPFWVDNRTGVPQIWTAAVDVDGEAVRHGDPALSGLEDVTDRTALEVERAGYEGSPAETVSLRVRLRNTSEDTLSAPVVLRLVDLWSEYGDAELLGDGPDVGGGDPAGADDGPRGAPGAVIPVTPHLPDGELPPGARSEPFEIRARIEVPARPGPMPPPPPDRDPGGGYGLLELEARALADVGRADDLRADRPAGTVRDESPGVSRTHRD